MDYEVVEKMNKAASRNVSSLKAMTDEVVVSNDELNRKFSEDWIRTFSDILKEIDETLIFLFIRRTRRIDAAAQRYWINRE